jgi:prepilin-type N-terminal cleavage/methylation domain-containing protein
MKTRIMSRHHTAGYSLIEILVVVVMAGILYSIAAPSWSAFNNSRRAGVAADQVLQSIRDSQNDARKERRSQILEFNPDAGTPGECDPNQFCYIRKGYSNAPIDELLTNVVGDNQIPQGEMAMRSFDATDVVVPAVIFDEHGNLDSDFIQQNNITLPITISVAIPENGNGARRCVIIETLLGATRSEQGDECPI